MSIKKDTHDRVSEKQFYMNGKLPLFSCPHRKVDYPTLRLIYDVQGFCLLHGPHKPICGVVCNGVCLLIIQKLHIFLLLLFLLVIV